MEKLWDQAGGHEMRTFEDTRGELKGVLGYTRHDELYSEIRPQEIQKRPDLAATPHKTKHDTYSPHVISTSIKVITIAKLVIIHLFVP